MSPALRLRGLTVRYRHGWLGRPSAIPAVDAVDLELAPGERVGLVGESGSGKTSLARAALGLLPIDGGTVEVLGHDWASLDPSARRALRRRAQLLLQSADAALNPGLTVRQILSGSARLHRPEEAAGPLVEETLRALGLEGRADALPRTLSGGEKRRVALGCVRIADPDLLIADEPTAGLDAARQAELLDRLVWMGNQNKTVLLISHDLAAVAYAVERVLVMLGGRIVEALPVRALSRGPHHPYTWALLLAARAADALAGDDPAPLAPSPGCPWRLGCASASARCAAERPPLETVAPDHQLACFHPGPAA